MVSNFKNGYFSHLYGYLTFFTHNCKMTPRIICLHENVKSQEEEGSGPFSCITG